MIGHHTTVGSGLSLQISFTTVSRCLLTMLISSCNCGTLICYATMMLSCSLSIRIYMIQLMPCRLVVSHGNVPLYHMMVPVPKACHHGWRQNTPYGTKIHTYSSRTCLQIHQQFDTNGSCWYEHFMSGDWAWDQAVSSLSLHS